MGTKNDKVILSLKKEIEKKKQILARTGRFVPVTNCSIELVGTRYNLHTANKETLLYLIANVKSMENALKDVMPEEKLIISGYSSTEWIADMVARFNIVNVSAEKERLRALEAKLHNLLSIDTKVELEIEELKSQI